MAAPLVLAKAAALPVQGYLIKPEDERDQAAAIQVAVAGIEESQTSARESAELRDDLETRKVVDRAKGKLMHQGKTEEEAYRAIQELARSQRITMRAAAEELIRKTAG